MSVSIPSYRHHRPSGQAVVTLNGHDFDLGKWKSPESRQEYDRLIAEWISNGRRIPSDASDTDLTIAELAISYLDFALEYYVYHGVTTSEYNCISNALKPQHELYSKTFISNFGPLALKAVRPQMIDQGWSRPYINRQVNRIRRMFRCGVENELVPPQCIACPVRGLPAQTGQDDCPGDRAMLFVTT